MKIFGIAVGLAALLSAGTASAGALVYDTITGQTVVAGFKPIVGANRGPLGDSFLATGPEVISGLTFTMKDVSPSDGGSVLVFLVPNNPPTGAPTLPSSTGTTLTGAIKLGKILDSAAPTTFGAVSLTTSASITAGTYWIELVDASSPANGDASPGPTGIQYAYALDAGSLGMPASGTVASYSNVDNGGLTAFTPGNGNVFMMQIRTPEPASLALLGAGMTVLGVIRRRRSKKSAA